MGLVLPRLEDMVDQIEEELNVKLVRFGWITGENAVPVFRSRQDDPAIGRKPIFEPDIFDNQVKLNLPVLGSRYGGKLAEIQRAFSSADKDALATRARANLTSELGGVHLQADELLITLSGKPGYAVAEEAGYAVAITTEVTPELADEGLARELVRRIQEMRKSAGFQIADRINLSYDGGEDVARVMQSWGDYIRQETLAERLFAGAEGTYAEDVDIDGDNVRLAVTRA
jgi:isoleucyl-tRNA synthetase